MEQDEGASLPHKVLMTGFGFFSECFCFLHALYPLEGNEPERTIFILVLISVRSVHNMWIAGISGMCNLI